MQSKIYFFLLFSITIFLFLKNRKLQKNIKKKEKEFEKFSCFFEFGTLSSGFFHDLVNPFQTLLLLVEKIKKENENSPLLYQTSFEHVYTATKKMENQLIKIKRQLENKNEKTYFFLSTIIFNAIDLLQYKSQKQNVEILFTKNAPIKYFGNPLHLEQILVNLISNAIDAYEECESTRKIVNVELTEKDTLIQIQIQDFGSGIPENIKASIFDPLFTTKANQKGLGIGLCMVKYRVEKNLCGSIYVRDNTPQGTCFTILFDAKKI